MTTSPEAALSCWHALEVLVSDGTRFELERDEPLKEGDFFTQFDVSYMVLKVQPG